MRTCQMKSFSDRKPALRPAVRYRREPAGAILFDPASLGIYATNRTGLLILKKINGRTSCAEIVELLRRRFVSTSKRTLWRDLHRFLEDLASVGLIDFEA
jgi:coenzyme PQQ synthesis protein D (PqqD)